MTIDAPSRAEGAGASVIAGAGLSSWLRTRIPPVSATELGVYRLLFGAGFAYVVYELRLSTEPFPAELHLRVHRLADYDWVHALAARPDLVERLEWAIVGLALAFAVGLFTRAALVALLAAVTVWTLVRLTRTGAHNWSALFVTMWAMLPVRWGDGFSFDALVRRRPTTASPGERRASYGYALWIPGLVFGSAMAGAGAAKLVQSGLSWITNASVKYHFVIDGEQAPTDWGLWIASHHGVALFMSAMAIVSELGLVIAVLVPSYLGRLPFAILGLGLLVGFYVFQNEMWVAWWLLYLAFFVPWPLLVRALSRSGAAPAPADRRVPWPQLAAIAAVCALQIVASVGRFEIAPVLSDYPMYSTTYASIAEFERRAGLSPEYHFTVRFADGVEADASEFFDGAQMDEPLRDAYIVVSENKALTDQRRAAIQTAAARASEHFGHPVRAIVVVIDQRGFDWEAGKFGWRAIRKPVHTFEVE